MRVLSLSDRPNHIRETAFLELEALAVFPEDMVSREQAMLLIHHELTRKAGTVGGHYRPSQLVNGVLTNIRKSQGRRVTAGLVALAMCFLNSMGKRMSLEKASEVVCELNCAADKHSFAYWKDGKWLVQEVRALGDKQKIKQAFREYRAVSHILAAGLVSSEYMELMEPFERSELADRVYFSTVLSFQGWLARVHNFDDWNLWHITYDLRQPHSEVPPFEVSQELFDAVMGPWMAKQEEAF